MDPFLAGLKSRLEGKFPQGLVEIVDFSAEHAGHTHGGRLHGDRVGTHLEIRLVSEFFAGKNRVQRERLLHDIFKEELISGRIHALVLKLKTPEENSQGTS